MRTIKIFLVLCLLTQALPAFSAESVRGEALVLFRTPECMTLTEQSLRDGEISRYIEAEAASADARVAGVYDALSLGNKEGNIFVFIVSDTKTTDELIAALKATPNVVSASPNRKTRLN